MRIALAWLALAAATAVSAAAAGPITDATNSAVACLVAGVIGVADGLVFARLMWAHGNARAERAAQRWLATGPLSGSIPSDLITTTKIGDGAIATGHITDRWPTNP